MGFDDAKARATRLAASVRNAPLPVAFGAAALVLALAIVLAVQLSGPRYNVLFEGLSPSQGGAVLQGLQKLGIPYRIENDGAEIEVPADDIGRARLQLGSIGEPGPEDGAEWGKLEDLPMTASQDAARVTELRATEASLERSIMEISGARSVRVMLAEPKDTPFLADQPRAKASVVVAGAAQPDAALGAAIAKVVAAAVTGLAVESVVVATQGGAVLYPSSPQDSVASQLGIQSAIEAAQEGKIQSLLTPIFGVGNYRVAVSADVDFETKQVKTETYGPASYPTSSNTEDRQQFGQETAAIGIPGALSNQPPGPTTAPLNPAAPAADAAAPAAAPPQTPAEIDAANQLALAKIPHSITKTQQQSFAVDHQEAVSQPAGWMVRGVSVAVAINQSALPASMRPEAIQAMIAASIAAPVGKIEVSAMQFLPPDSGAALSVEQAIPSVAIKGGLLALGVLAAIFGVVRPMLAWMKGLAMSRPTVPERPVAEIEDDEAAERRAAARAMVRRANELAQTAPVAVAGVLQQWLDHADG
jgi:flagellar M-ring protein FliF